MTRPEPDLFEQIWVEAQRAEHAETMLAEIYMRDNMFTGFYGCFRLARWACARSREVDDFARRFSMRDGKHYPEDPECEFCGSPDCFWVSTIVTPPRAVLVVFETE